MAGEQQRRNTRVEFHAVVNLTAGGAVYRNCETKDLSLRGVYVVGVEEPADGETCGIELCLSGTSSSVCLNMEGQVVRHDAGGIAVNFTGMDPDSYFHLKHIVYFNSADPDGLEDSP
jgi:hypothetical protein